MQPFITLSGPAAPFVRRDVDTDVIIRVERLTGIPKEELGPFALEALRGPDFVLDQPTFKGAPILLAGENFGCGSSREAAVWALQATGLRCIIAPSFGDIFFANCFQNGMLPVVLPEEAVRSIADEASKGAPVTVSLQDNRVISPRGEIYEFALDPLRREMLLEGTDELGLTLRRSAEIANWQRRYGGRSPWMLPGRKIERQATHF